MTPNRNTIFWLAIGALAIGLVALLLNDGQGAVFGLTTDNFARGLYLTVLAIVILTGIIGSGLRFGQMARALLIWMAIILGLMVSYQYRYELQDVASRLSAGMIAGSPLSMTDEDGRAAVMIDRMANGHFEVRTQVNGAPVTMMIDTGASSTVLTFEDAGRAGYDVETLIFDVPIMTANGRTHAARVVADAISIGEITRQRLPMMVAQDGRLERSLLGMNFIGTLSGFDMRGERLILRE